MNRKNFYILLGTTIACGLASWAYYDLYINQPKIHEHGVGTRKMSCGDSAMTSLELLVNNTPVWNKSHEEFFNSADAKPTSDRRFKGSNIISLYSLQDGYENITSIEVIPCDADDLILDDQKITDNSIYLALSKRERMKLMQDNGKKKPTTLLRNVIRLNFRTN